MKLPPREMSIYGFDISTRELLVFRSQNYLFFLRWKITITMAFEEIWSVALVNFSSI